MFRSLLILCVALTAVSSPAADMQVTLPVMNTGPGAGGKPDKPIGTFDPHSSPAGLVWIEGDAYPAEDRGSLFVVRYGNLLAGKDSGFDLVRVRPQALPGRGTTFEAGSSQPGRLLEMRVVPR